VAVDRAIARTALTDVRRQVIGTLSKGFRQRVGLAQAIVHNPPVLILDEPTAGLDPLQIREIRALIAELTAPSQGDTQHTVILSTHILAEVDAICRRVILINQGRKVVDAPLSELMSGGRTLDQIFTEHTAHDAVDAAALPSKPTVESESGSAS
jgi:ABC-2 type transport system ATP-binding protein